MVVFVRLSFFWFLVNGWKISGKLNFYLNIYIYCKDPNYWDDGKAVNDGSKGLVYLYIPKNLRITTVHSFPFINVHLPLRSASVYTNLILNLGWCCRSFFIAFFTLFHLYLIHSVVKTHTHIHTYILPTDMCKCSLFWMQIRDAFFPLWYCFLE